MKMSSKQNERTQPQETFLDQSSLMELVLAIYDQYYTSIAFHQIDFIIGQPLPGMLDAAKSQNFLDFVCLIDGCLLFREKSFYALYDFLLKCVQDQKRQLGVRHKCAEILLSMNGQNDKGYNLKKVEIQKKIADFSMACLEEKEKNITYLRHELSLNEAIIMKFKKTSSSYEYRFRVLSALLLYTNKTLSDIQTLLTQEHQLMVRILARFPRNYFCWMYRVRLFKQIYSLLPHPQILKCQLDQIQGYLENNPNDYSILSYYRFLLRQMQQGKSEKLAEVTKKVQKLLQFCRMGYEQEQEFMNLVKFSEELKRMNEDNQSKKVDN